MCNICIAGRGFWTRLKSAGSERRLEDGGSGRVNERLISNDLHLCVFNGSDSTAVRFGTEKPKTLRRPSGLKRFLSSSKSNAGFIGESILVKCVLNRSE